MTEHRDIDAKLLALAVHEFRTPVSVVDGYLHILGRHFGDGLSERQHKLVEDAGRACGHVAALISELSDLADLAADRLSLARTPVDVAAILARLPNELTEGRDRGVTLTVTGCDGALPVVGDEGRLHDALATLAAATLRERPGPASIVMACRVLDTPHGSTLKIAAGDSGAADAFLEEQDAAAGELDEYRGGLGFRFILAARIVAAHGGRVTSPVTRRGQLSLVITLPVACGGQAQQR